MSSVHTCVCVCMCVFPSLGGAGSLQVSLILLCGFGQVFFPLWATGFPWMGGGVGAGVSRAPAPPLDWLPEAVFLGLQEQGRRQDRI